MTAADPFGIVALVEEEFERCFRRREEWSAAQAFKNAMMWGRLESVKSETEGGTERVMDEKNGSGWRSGHPKKRGYYLAAWMNGNAPTVSELWFNHEAFPNQWYPGRGYLGEPFRSVKCIKTVFAWMPLPAAPEEGQKGARDRVKDLGDLTESRFLEVNKRLTQMQRDTDNSFRAIEKRLGRRFLVLKDLCRSVGVRMSEEDE